MPCYDDRDSCLRSEDLEKKVDLYARWLCAILRPMPKEIVGVLPQDLQTWWYEHKKFDKERGA